MSSKERTIDGIIKAVIAVSPDIDPDMSVEEWRLRCAVNGVDPSFDDDNFVMFVFGKTGQEQDPDLLRAVKKSLWLKPLRPDRNPAHDTLLLTILTVEIARYRDYFTTMADYAMKHFPETESGKTAIRLAYATGLTTLGLGELYELKRKHLA